MSGFRKAVGGLSAEQASKVLAKIGDTTLRLGDYAVLLERMDRFERMRYQSEDRRAALLDEMINVELLAAEAIRRGLDKQPETQALLWQAMRDELFAELRRGLPRRDSLSMSEVSEYFEAHRAEFALPEMRRLAQIVTADRKRAEQALEASADSSPKLWAVLEKEFSDPGVERRALVPQRGQAVAGDLGFVALGSTESGGRSEIPLELRKALFSLERDGEVFAQVVSSGGRFCVIRRVALNPPRLRELREVEEVVRNRLLEEKFVQARDALMGQLRKEIPVVINEQALSRLQALSPADQP